MWRRPPCAWRVRGISNRSTKNALEHPCRINDAHAARRGTARDENVRNAPRPRKPWPKGFARPCRALKKVGIRELLHPPRRIHFATVVDAKDGLDCARVPFRVRKHFFDGFDFRGRSCETRPLNVCHVGDYGFGGYSCGAPRVVVWPARPHGFLCGYVADCDGDVCSLIRAADGNGVDECRIPTRPTSRGGPGCRRDGCARGEG